MTSRRHLGLVAAAATLLSALPLSTVFQQWTWFVRSVIAVAFVAGAAMLVRSLRAPAWAQLAGMAGALLVVLTFLTPDSEAVLGLVPTTDTFTRFSQLLNEAGTAMREMGVPVNDHEGLLFLTVLGVGSVAVCVDLCAVALRRPALAGLPMLAIYSVPVAVRQESVSFIPFVAGAAGFLWLLATDNVDRVRRFGRRFTGDGRDIDLWEPSPLAAAGRRLAVVGVLVAIILPVAVPGMTSGLLDRFGSGGAGAGSGTGSGRGRQVNLWAMLEGTLKQEDEFELVRLTTSDPDPGYLRFGVADELSLDGFRNRPPSGSRTATAGNLPDPRRGGRAGVDFYAGKATVDIVNLNMSLLPVYSGTTAVRGLESKWFYDPRMQVIYSTSATTGGKKYEFDYVRSEYSGSALRTAPPLPADDEVRRLNSALPGNVQQVEAEVERITRGKSTDYDKVRALYDFFSAKNNFTYSLEAKSETGGGAMVDFLERRSGYCVQYAAALAWMVREAGIPARVAFGFTRGTKGQDNTYSLTNRNLHAWTEVYFNGFGWVPFDATPSTYVTGSVDPEWAPNPDAPEGGPTGPEGGASPGPTGSSEAGDADARADRLLGEDETAGLPGVSPQGPRWPRYLAFGGLLALLVLAMPALRRALLRSRRRPRPAAGRAVAGDARPGEASVVVAGGPDAARARHNAHAAWDELIDTLVDFRVPIDLTETPRATAERVVRDTELRDDTARGARLLGRAEERARYARDPLLTDELGRSLRSVRRELAGRAPRRIRLGALLLPPSVLIKWRQSIIWGTTTIVAALGQWRDAVVHTVSPRRLLSPRGTR